jgi:hypothetical protein
MKRGIREITSAENRTFPSNATNSCALQSSARTSPALASTVIPKSFTLGNSKTIPVAVEFASAVRGAMSRASRRYPGAD